MQRFRIAASLLTLASVSVFAVSCSGVGHSASQQDGETQVTETTAEVKDTTQDDKITSSPAEVKGDSQAGEELKSLTLTNSETGETFALADFQGQTVLVKSMATWCGKCKANLNSIKAAKAQLNDPNIVVVALSVEANLPDETLAQYAQDEEFDFVFAVATPEMTRSLASEFGQTALNPSIGSHFIIQPNGTMSDLTTGAIDPQELVTRLQAANQQASVR